MLQVTIRPLELSSHSFLVQLNVRDSGSAGKHQHRDDIDCCHAIYSKCSLRLSIIHTSVSRGLKIK